MNKKLRPGVMPAPKKPKKKPSGMTGMGAMAKASAKPPKKKKQMY